MANYRYQKVISLIPKKYFENFEFKHSREFDYDPNGDYWLVASEYIQDLEKEITKLNKKRINLWVQEALTKLF